MSPPFYGKNDVEIDNQVQQLIERLDMIRRAYPKEAEYIYRGGKVFKDYDDKLRERVADLLNQESKWTRVGTVVGAAVCGLAIWELFQSAKIVLTWVGHKIVQSDNVDVSQFRRAHARHWNNN